MSAFWAAVMGATSGVLFVVVFSVAFLLINTAHDKRVGREHARQRPPKPQQWKPPTDLTGEQMEWLRIQMDLAGQPMPKPDRRARYHRI